MLPSEAIPGDSSRGEGESLVRMAELLCWWKIPHLLDSSFGVSATGVRFPAAFEAACKNLITLFCSYGPDNEVNLKEE